MKKRDFIGGILGAGVASMVPQLMAKTPSLVQLIVPFAAGGVADALARLLADAVQRVGGQTVVVVNRPGASGIVAAGALMRSRPDEAVFMLSSTSQLLQPLVAPSNASVREVFDGLRYSHLLCQQDSFMVVSAASGVRTVAGFVGKFQNQSSMPNLGTLGVGSVGHLLGSTFADKANLKHVHIPYNGSPAIMHGLLSGDIHYAFTAFENFRSHLDSGALLPLAVASEKRSTLLAHVPAAPDLGFKSVNRGTWFALAHAAHADARFVSGFIADLERVMMSKMLMAEMSAMGLQPNFKSGEKLDKFMASERSYWSNRVAEVL